MVCDIPIHSHPVILIPSVFISYFVTYYHSCIIPARLFPFPPIPICPVPILLLHNEVTYSY